MTRERFAELAEAFGGDIDRWPASEQDQARAFWGANLSDAQGLLDEAHGLDALLAASPEPQMSGVLRETIVRSAGPAPRPAGEGRAPVRRPAWRSPMRWASGLGLAAACAAGVVFGATFSGQLVGDPALDALEQASTAFDAALTYDLEDTAG